jgi:DNA-binding NtrC family response regulator
MAKCAHERRNLAREIEFPLISAALAATSFNLTKAAELLGLNRNTLRKKLFSTSSRCVRRTDAANQHCQREVQWEHRTT